MKVVNYQGPKIKYDKRDNRIGLMVAVVCTIVAIVENIIMFLPVSERMSTELGVFISLGGFMFFPMIALAGWHIYFMSFCYFRRLQKYGFQVPENKKDYQGRLEALERGEYQQPDLQAWHKDSMILAGLTLVMAVGTAVYAFYVRESYPQIELCFWLMLFPVLCWILLGALFWSERSQLKFKDDVEIDEKRRTRLNLMEGITVILICLFMTVIYAVVIYNMAGVIYKARLANGWYQ
ncbi:MAG: hypothetical protein IJ379_12400 [Lachnospiraceae bacterium]|nr:hypothetical protein [Lachnospiraceae bacterium]